MLLNRWSRLLVCLLMLAMVPGVCAEPLPLVYVLTTGGTIASRAKDTLGLSDYGPGATGLKRLDAPSLVASVPELNRVARVEVEQIADTGSANITVALWLKLAERVNAILARPEVTGLVVTHGTDTLEETAYFLNLVVRTEKPVVLVGSLRPATALSADGPLNLVNAVRTAAAPASRGKGVLVVLNDEINAAREVTKTNTRRLEAFRSPDVGFLGYADPDAVVYYREPTRRHTYRSEFDLTGKKELPTVEIVTSYIGSSRAVIDMWVKAGVRGLVVAGSGGGGVTEDQRTAIKEAAKNVAVVSSSRTGSGRVLDSPRLQQDGIIAADNLSAQKARILLMLALTKTSDRAEIRRIFNEY